MFRLWHRTETNTAAAPTANARKGGWLEKFSLDQRGTTAMIFALSAIPTIGIMGSAIDYARAVSAQSRMQYALDAAVLAAVNEDPSVQPNVALQYFNANFEGGGAVAASIVRTTFSQDSSGNLTGEANADVPMSFMQVLHFDSVNVAVAASAKPLVASTTTTPVTTTVTKTVKGSYPCIHVMDQNAQYAFKEVSNSQLDARYCEVHVRSNDSHAIYTDSETQVKWKRMWVKGAGGTMLSGKDTIMDSPFAVQYNMPVVADPYAPAISDVVHAMTVGSCTSANTGKSYTGGTVSPGTYCGTTTFNGVKFTKGVYIIASTTGNKNGLLNLTGKLDGSAGVSFYFADNKATMGTFTPSEYSNLTAINTGTTRGLLFFEGSNRGSNWTFTANSMSKVFLNGVIYLPSANMTIKSWSMDSGQTMYFALICNTLYVDSWSGVTNVYAWTPFNATDPITFADEITTVTTTGTSTTTDTKEGFLRR